MTNTETHRERAGERRDTARERENTEREQNQENERERESVCVCVIIDDKKRQTQTGERCTYLGKGDACLHKRSCGSRVTLESHNRVFTWCSSRLFLFYLRGLPARRRERGQTYRAKERKQNTETRQKEIIDDRHRESNKRRRM